MLSYCVRLQLVGTRQRSTNVSDARRVVRIVSSHWLAAAASVAIVARRALQQFLPML
jgi:hypothetical protein